ncbi:MAG: hypothetical protein HC804_02365 [Anaerolineae bacterium]|nr:hypothetical protein [Anaerolineae bacterium]
MPTQLPSVPPADKRLVDVFALFLEQPGRGLSTKRKFRAKFKLFLGRYGERPVGLITADVLEEWFCFLEERKGYSEGHLAFHRSSQRTFWKWAAAAGWVAVNPATNDQELFGQPGACGDCE